MTYEHCIVSISSCYNKEYLHIFRLPLITSDVTSLASESLRIEFETIDEVDLPLYVSYRLPLLQYHNILHGCKPLHFSYHMFIPQSRRILLPY